MEIDNADMINNQIFELYPEYKISVALFENVCNTVELREMLMKGKLQAAMINATMIPDVFCVQVAANKAIHLNTISRLRTRSIHSEILFNLSPTNNISESFKTFGFNDKEVSVLVVVISKCDSDNINDILSHVKGTQITVDHLKNIANEDKIKKIYKISDAELTCGALVDAVVTRIATKDANS